MILTGHAITRARARGDITLVPFDPAAVNPNSYNYKLGPELIEFPEWQVSPQQPGTRHTIPEEGFLLMPGKLYLGSTLERIGSKRYAMSLIGRSTIGRLGMWLQVTADLGHVGANHHWTLEIKVVQPLRVFASMTVGQVSFWRCQGTTKPYRGRYRSDTTPVTSRL